MVVSDAGQEAENACGDCAGKQDGASDLGHGDEEKGLRESGTGCCCMTEVQREVDGCR